MSFSEEKSLETSYPNDSLPNPNNLSTTPPIQAQESKKGFFRDTFESALVTVIMALFGMTFVVQAVKVPTGSMLNTILVGDHLLVNKFIFGQDGLMLDKFTPHRPIKRGDVIVFKYPNDPTTNYVKRVIGLPGETIEMKGNSIFINGKELAEQYVLADQPLGDPYAPLEVVNVKEAPLGASYKAYYSYEYDPAEAVMEKSLAGQKFAIEAPFQIPPDHYFAMGDNRDNSQDSRYWGTVPRQNIVGRAWVVYYSLDASKDGLGKTTSGYLLVDLFTRTRWNRIGTLIK
ncbi:MAG: signal peptidase I [Acidobacteria bacterium]|nr:signal peptidase I [Acidobacteriota bacterium]